MAKKNATIYDVAKLANVSLATASRVMNGIDKVAPDTRQKVLDAIKELNYKPSSIAVELASKRSTNVAIIVPELNYTYISHVVAGMMETATEIGYDCLIFTTKGTKLDFSKTISKVVSLRPNGIIIFNDTLTDEEAQEILQFDIPTVTLGMELNNLSSVTWHYKNQIIDIVTNTLSRNKEVCFLEVSDIPSRMDARICDGIKKAYEANGKEFNPEKNVLKIKDSYTATYNIVTEALPNLNNVVFISARDSIALAALNACLDLGYNCPEQFEFLSVIGTKYSELSRPKLSSFNIDMRGFGRDGMKVLAEVIENEGNVISKKLSFSLVKRGSTL